MGDKLQHKKSRWGTGAHLAFNQICGTCSIQTHEGTRRWHVKALESANGEKNNSSGLFTMSCFTIQEKKNKNPVVKDIVNSLRTWVQSLTCQQTLSATFRKITSFVLIYLPVCKMGIVAFLHCSARQQKFRAWRCSDATESMAAPQKLNIPHLMEWLLMCM